MSNRNGKNKFNVVRFLGLVLMPLLAGGALGAYGAFFMYSKFIGSIEACTLSEVEIEYGHPITVDSFFTRVPVNTTFITDINQIDTGKLASYQIYLDCGGHTVSSILKVVDKTAPTAQAVPVDMFCGKAPDPKTLVKNVFDLTNVTIEYAEGEPDLIMNTGEFTVPVKLTDSNGNSSIIEVPFNVKDDHTPPVISGVRSFEHVAKDKELLDANDFLEGVTVTDDYTSMPKLEVDYSKVNQKLVGKYPITYIATDKAGNRTEVESSVTVYRTYNGGVSTSAKYEKLAKEQGKKVLAKIVKASDTDVEKAMKVYYWVHHNVYFLRGSTPYKGREKAAYYCLKNKKGSCYGRACACKVMLDLLNIDNYLICRKKIPGRAIHYWNLVKLNGEWYHCDVQIYLNTQRWVFDFMATDKEINKHDTHTFLKSGFPKRATKSVQKYLDIKNGKIKSNFPYKKNK